MRSRITQESGMTIIEILVALVIFMAGFSVLIALMNSTLVRFSTKELLAADGLAQEAMVRSTAERDTTLLDTIVIRSGLELRVTRSIEIDEKLAKVEVTVYRNKQGRKLAELYSAFALSRQ